MKKVILLASASTTEGIIRMIKAYWYCQHVEVQPIEGSDHFDVYQSGQRMENFRVIYKAKRFRFEGIL